jgi:hypothetical protein
MARSAKVRGPILPDQDSGMEEVFERVFSDA